MPSWSPEEIDPTQPSVARVYDFYLGGSHNFEADRAFGRHAVEIIPDLPTIAKDNRAFLRRAVEYAAAEGVDQFLDLGSGIPTVGNVHEVAHHVDPDARVVYVDHDPVAVAHAQALLADDARVAAVMGDVRDPRRVLDAVRATGLLDPGRRVLVLLIAVLHFVTDDEDPAGLIDTYVDAWAPGSLVAVSHGRSDAPGMAEIAALYNRPGSPSRARLRNRTEVEALLGRLTRIGPGVVEVPRWRPDLDAADASDGEPPDKNLAGMGRRDWS